MNILFLRRLALAFVVLTLTVLLSGCLLPGGGGYYDGGDIGAAYYEPSGVEYGGWGHGYHVAPFRGGVHRQTGGGAHAYRSAPASHATPSLPSHGGGGHGGSSGKRR